MDRLDTFSDKLLERLDKIDSDQIKNYVYGILENKDFLCKILASLPDGLVVIGKNGNIRYSNDIAQKLFMKSESDNDLSMHEYFQDKVLCEFISEHIKEGRRRIDHEIEVKEPKSIRISVSCVPLYETDGTITAYIIVLRDVSALCSDEEEKINSLANLAAGIAHDLGNPLNTINIYLKLILRELNEKGKKKISNWIGVISDETNRLDRLVKDFLDVTREKVSPFKKANINDCIDNTINFIMPEFQKYGIQTEVALMNSIPEFFLDSDKMHEAFQNIFRNAIEAMPEGGLLKVRSAMKEHLVTITFKDDGIGIAEKDLPYVFDAYYTNKNSGVGLGLMNVYNIIKAHNGRVYIESKLGKGTTVTVIVPIRRDKLRIEK